MSIKENNLQHWTRTETGLIRRRNEDALVACPEIGLFAVADGMGGHAHGDVASATTIQVVNDTLSAHRGNLTLSKRGFLIGISPKHILESAVQRANAAIYELSYNYKETMGTTFCGAVIHGSKAFIAHVGDSRAYLFRGRSPTILTFDHTVAGQRLRTGTLDLREDLGARYHNMLLKAIGTRKSVEVDMIEIDLLPSDRLLFCTDGVSRGLSVRQIGNYVIGYSGQTVIDNLIEAALDDGGKDNATAVLVDMGT